MKLLKYIYSISLIGWIVFLSAIILFGNTDDSSIARFPYYFEKQNYDSFAEVIEVLFNLDKYHLSFFDWCCDCINYKCSNEKLRIILDIHKTFRT